LKDQCSCIFVFFGTVFAALDRVGLSLIGELYEYSHILLGAQVKGGDSVGELVNMFSVIIQNRMTDMEIDTLQLGSHPLLTSSPAVQMDYINLAQED